MSEYYIKSLCEPMMNKYLFDAINNGFEDYEISRFRMIELEDYLIEKKT